ncbi:MAG: lipase family protein [Bacilli bacterium]|nr:lipase family protein [Bacilli bacterium]
MTNKNLFLYIKQYKKSDYKTAGIDVQYQIEIRPDERKVILIFSESNSNQDWKTNFNFPAKLYKNQKGDFLVHGGYVNAWKSCNDEIMNSFIESCKQLPEYTPLITGWSFGGAMSQLAAEDFYFRSGKKADVITFGSPKILYFKKSQKHFRASCNDIKQYTRINDFVTWNIPFPFVHFIEKTMLKERFSLKMIFNTAYTHTHYDELL